MALLIRYERVGYALVVTALLSGVWDWVANRHFFGVPGANLFMTFDRLYGATVIIFLVITAFCIARMKGLKPCRVPEQQ